MGRQQAPGGIVTNTAGELLGLSRAEAIRRAVAACDRRGLPPPELVGAVVEYLAEHGRPGVPRQRVCDVLARLGRPVGRDHIRSPAPRADGQAAAIREAIAAVGDDPGAVVEHLAGHGHPGIAKQRVYDVLRRDGRPIGKPRPTLPAENSRAGEADGRGELARFWADVARDRQAAPPEAIRLGVREPADPADGGMPCPDSACGEAMRWAGGYTALVCIEHPRGEKRWRRDQLATQRAAERKTALAPARQSGPGPAERARVAEAAAVALDQLDGYRELLRAIPRDDDHRAAAIRALHQLDQLAGQYRAAGSLAELQTAEARDAELTSNDDDDPGQLDEVLTYAEQLDASRRKAARRAERKAQGGGRFLAFARRGETWAYDDQADDDQADDDQADDEQAEAPDGLGELAALVREQIAADYAEHPARIDAVARVLAQLAQARPDVALLRSARPGIPGGDLRRAEQHVDRMLSGAALHAFAPGSSPACQACTWAGIAGSFAAGRFELGGAALGILAPDAHQQDRVLNLCRAHGAEAQARVWAGRGMLTCIVTFPAAPADPIERRKLTAARPKEPAVIGGRLEWLQP